MHGNAKAECPSVEQELARILTSQQFRESPRLQTFLRFVVCLTLDGKADEIKESTIAAEVFGREDTRDDSIVRSAARRLRMRLEEYYQQAGFNDSLRIVIPKGSYVPVFEEQRAPANATQEISALPPVERARPALEVDERNRKASRKLLAFAAAALVILFGVAVASHASRRGQSYNLEAKELYLKGRYYWSRRTPEDLNRAVDYFTQAIVKDPRYAQAYSGLADAYNLLSEYTLMPYQEAFKRAIAAAKTAIALDDTLAEAHNSLAFASFYGAWDSVTAEREFRRALQLDPQYVTAHHWYATFLMSLGREHEALAEIERAQVLDPSSKSILADKGLILMHSGQIAAAMALLEELAASDPQFLSPHQYLASVYLLERRYPDYLSELRKVAQLSHDIKGLAVAEAGEEGFAQNGATRMLTQMLAAQQASHAGQDARYYSLAQVCALLGDKSEAINYLKLALNGREANTLVLAVDEPFAQMRGDPTFRELVRRVGVMR